MLVIDVQRDVMAAAWHRDEVIATIVDVVDRARAAGVPVVWVQHSDDAMPRDSEGWQYVPELVPGADEPLVHKRFGDSFADTDLADVLAERGVGHVVVVGAQTDACIRSTLHSALVRGYDVTLVSDAHTTEDLRQWGSPISPEQAVGYTNLYWAFSAAPGSRGTVVSAAELALGS